MLTTYRICGTVTGQTRVRIAERARQVMIHEGVYDIT